MSLSAAISLETGIPVVVHTTGVKGKTGFIVDTPFSIHP